MLFSFANMVSNPHPNRRKMINRLRSKNPNDTRNNIHVYAHACGMMRHDMKEKRISSNLRYDGKFMGLRAYRRRFFSLLVATVAVACVIEVLQKSYCVT